MDHSHQMNALVTTLINPFTHVEAVRFESDKTAGCAVDHSGGQGEADEDQQKRQDDHIDEREQQQAGKAEGRAGKLFGRQQQASLVKQSIEIEQGQYENQLDQAGIEMIAGAQDAFQRPV